MHFAFVKLTRLRIEAMSYPNRPIAFVMASSNHGNLIVNRHDYRMVDDSRGYGVGFQILNKSSFDPEEVNFALALLDSRRKYYGDDVFAIDGGANIGVHTVEWSRHMHGWGRVLAFEAQEVVYYALAGNIAVNNCLNARARHSALGEVCGELCIPQPDYFAPASFGSLELRYRPSTEFIGQAVSYESNDCTAVPMSSLDSLGLPRVDLIKIDVEGMELEVLRGAKDVMRRLRPLLIVEAIKSDRAALEAVLREMEYQVFKLGINLLAVHNSDPTLKHVTQTTNGINFTVV
jgi:FkbM family methyltransferase